MDFFCFDQPFDLHFQTESYCGWPRIVVKIWKLDQTNTIDLLSYGTMNLPNSPGYHELSFAKWSLHGNIIEETLSYFLDSKPMKIIAKVFQEIWIHIHLLYLQFQTLWFFPE